MRQYAEQKQQVGDAMLLFRMGDFYELFYEDAARGAKLLGIALTSRDNGRTPLAGIPHHALNSYLSRLVAAGVKVAISEQIEDASQAKGVIRRAVVRIVTPGTLTDEALLDQRRSNRLVAVLVQGERAGLATLELSTGELVVEHCPLPRLADELTRIAPAEVLLPETSLDDPVAAALRERLAVACTMRPLGDFAPQQSARRLREQFETAGLEGWGFDALDASLQAAGALLAYVHETQKAASEHLQPPRRRAPDDYVLLDATTLRSLEIERTLRTQAREGSLLAAVDRTSNPMGARRLREWLCYPLRSASAIRERGEAIGRLRADKAARTALRAALRDMGDIERIVGRLGVQRTHPRDLRSLGNGLAALRPIAERLGALGGAWAAALAERLSGLEPLAQRLCEALRADAPLTVREGGIFNDGYHPEIDRLRRLGSDGQAWLSRFQARQVERTGIASLKVGYNRVFGFYIEVTHPHRDRVPPDYVRKQTLKNAERYITDELKQHESDVLSAEARVKDLEHELFVELRRELSPHIPRLQAAAAALAELDVLAGWAELAVERRYCRPEFVDHPALEIDAGRHPVIEQVLGDEFVPNDTRLSAGPAAGEARRPPAATDSEFAGAGAAEPPAFGDACLALITGPNMAGKSTYIRQVALLTLLAHCGCWVPARRMTLGLVDRIFTRVGAADELARGQSTFMVEMLETANILHNATGDSLVILDEVGRGTSTFDGLSLAWAIAEHLAQRGCRALFATHYHELTELAELLDGVSNLNVAVREFEDQVVFLHKIVAGAADRSYGLHVAKLAGVPRSAIERAHEVLLELEKTFQRESQRPALAAAQRRRKRQLRLFEEPEEQVVRELRELEPGVLSLDAARELLVRWRGLLS
ncbi:MAG: DNA mismatch repair protein MutS [Phycisphaerae bacterium]|nr:DNA mismatch repair protein MutS [Phycisphaerae bacterium]MCZ2398915.1 DNA mismatch repair protein MutS [Phycisphaerae bacterium]